MRSPKFLAVALALAGCGSDPKTAAPADGGLDVLVDASGDANDTSAPADASEDTSSIDASTNDGGDADAPPPCHAVVPEGPIVVVETASGPMPTAKGGTVSDGVYEQVALVKYGATAFLPPKRATMKFSSSVVQHALEDKTVSRWTLSWKTTGASFVLGFECPSSSYALTGDYDAIGDELVLYLPKDNAALRYKRK